MAVHQVVANGQFLQYPSYHQFFLHEHGLQPDQVQMYLEVAFVYLVCPLEYVIAFSSPHSFLPQPVSSLPIIQTTVLHLSCRQCLDDIQIQPDKEQVCLALFTLGGRDKAKIRQLWRQSLIMANNDPQRITKHTILRVSDEIAASEPNLHGGYQSYSEKIIADYVQFKDSVDNERRSIEVLRGEGEPLFESPGAFHFEVKFSD